MAQEAEASRAAIAGCLTSRPMPKPTAASIATALTVPERILLFCLASGTDWQAVSVTHATAQQMMVRGLIVRQAAARYVLTERGPAVLAALLGR
jgi:hypothetical protein